MIINSQIASIESKFAGYKEELEEKIVTEAEGDREKVNLLNENVKSYIPSLEENDVGNFAIVEGELYYLGDDELSKKAAKNQKMEVMDSGVETESNVASRIEEKAIDSMLKSRGKDAFEYTDENGDQKLVGIELIKKNLVNANNWKIVTETGEGGKIKKTYDEGYYYIPNGTNISGIGKTTCGYIVDYGSDDVIQYKEGIHKYFSYEDSVAVTDHLLFNADPGVIDSYFSDKNNFKKDDLGKGIEFYGYGDGEEPDFDQAFTPTSFIFDGYDDYITVECKSEEDKGNIKNYGFTFEFYGKIYKDGYLYNKYTQSYEKNNHYRGLFSYWSGDDAENAVFRFGIFPDDWGLSWSVMPWGKDFSNPCYLGPQAWDGQNCWNQRTKNNDFNFGNDIYLTIVFDPAKVENITGETAEGVKFENNECIKQIIYVEDEMMVDGWYNKKIWDSAVEKQLGKLNLFCLGTCSMGNAYWWYNSNMECYSLRFYNRALKDDEVHKNYDKTIEYHKILESQNKEG